MADYTPSYRSRAYVSGQSYQEDGEAPPMWLTFGIIYSFILLLFLILREPKKRRRRR